MSIDSDNNELPGSKNHDDLESFNHLRRDPKIYSPLRVGFYWVLACFLVVVILNIGSTLIGQKPNPFIALMAVGTPAGAVMIVGAIAIVFSNETDWRQRSQGVWFVGGALLAQTIMFANYDSKSGFFISMMRATELAWIPFGAFTAALTIFWLWGTNIIPPELDDRRRLSVKHLLQITFAGALLCSLSRTALSYRIEDIGMGEQFTILLSLFITGFLFAAFTVLLLHASLARLWWLYIPAILLLTALVAAPILLGPVASMRIDAAETGGLVAMALLLGFEIWFLVFLFYLEGLKLGKRYTSNPTHDGLD